MLALIAHASLSLVGAAPLLAVALLGALQAISLVGARRRLGPRGPSTRHFASAAAGALVLGVALSPLFDSERLVSVHMLQHALLIGVAAPLLALGAPLTLLLCLVRPPVRTRIHRLRRVFGSGGERMLWVALLLHLGTVTVWHVPWLYERAISPGAPHLVQHTLFVATALALWWLILGGGTPVELSVSRITVLAFIALHGAVLGALLAFSSTPWYGSYAAAPDPLADQQLGGLVMWSVGGIAPVTVAFVLVARWLDRSHGRPARILGS